MSQVIDGKRVKYKVLIVDDSSIEIDVIRTALGGGFRILAANNGETALCVAREHHPDLILLDVLMPGMDGHEVCRRLKADAATRDIPVIFVTGLDSDAEEVSGFALGAVDYVSKPIEPVVLRARVQAQAELACTRKALTRINRRLENERELIAGTIRNMREAYPVYGRHLEYVSRSADEASGDVVFSALSPDGEQHVLVGDFTGHGLPAAIGAPLVSYLFYSLTAQAMPLHEILVTINNELVRQLPTNVFLVAVALALAPEGQHVRWWSFGAPDVLQHGKDGNWQTLHSKELPMGIVSHQAQYEPGTLTLKQGESLFVMSDGALETVCQDGSMFGSERLKQALERHAMQLEPVVGELLECADRDTELDDITLLRLGSPGESGVLNDVGDGEGEIDDR